jgi:hypothetical protein
MDTHVDSHSKEGFEMFSGDYYQEQFDGFMFTNDPQTLPFDNMTISNPMNQYYPATIAPSALTSSPHDFRRSDSPDATIVGPRNAVPGNNQPNASAYAPMHHPLVQALAAAAGESSSSPSSADLGTVPMPSSAILNGHVTLPLHHNHSTSSLSSVNADIGSRPRSSRASPPSSSRDSPRVRSRTPAPGTPPKRNGGGLVHRHSRNASTASSTRPARRGSVRKPKEEDDFSDFEEDDDFALHAADGKPERRREDIRKQRIESEQRRRDELREGYNRLKQALPPSNQKSSKASILERATVCITDLNQKTGSLAARVEELESELRRVRVLNETLMLSAAEHRFAAAQAGVHLPFQSA